MTEWLAYESVYSIQERAHRHWCRVEALLLATDVMMKHDLGGGGGAVAAARRSAGEKSHSRHEIRRVLVAMASDEGREIVSFGHDELGLVASVVYFPAAQMTFEPSWVPQKCTQLFGSYWRCLSKPSYRLLPRSKTPRQPLVSRTCLPSTSPHRIRAAPRRPRGAQLRLEAPGAVRGARGLL